MRKVIVISGGGDGLGGVIARRLKDHQVIILGRTLSSLEETARTHGLEYELCDISDTAQVESVIKKIVQRCGGIDILINNAAVWIQGGLVENDPVQIKYAIDVNTTGTILLTKAVAAVMKDKKNGLIVNINSQAGFYAKAERSIYTASKWAITGFTKALQSELAQYGIRVTGVYPGKMKTGMFAKVGIPKDMSDALDPEEVARVVEFLVESSPEVLFPEIGIKYIGN